MNTIDKDVALVYLALAGAMVAGAVCLGTGFWIGRTLKKKFKK